VPSKRGGESDEPVSSHVPWYRGACKDMPDIHLADPKAGIYEKGPGKVWPHPPLPELPRKAPSASLIPSRRVVAAGVLSTGAGLVAAAHLARARKRWAELQNFSRKEDQGSCICSATMTFKGETASEATTIVFAVAPDAEASVGAGSGAGGSEGFQIRAITLVRGPALSPLHGAAVEGSAAHERESDNAVCEEVCAQQHAPMVAAFLLRLVREAVLQAEVGARVFVVVLNFGNKSVELVFEKTGNELLHAVGRYAASLVGSDLGSWHVNIGSNSVTEIFTDDSKEKNASLMIAEELRERKKNSIPNSHSSASRKKDRRRTSDTTGGYIVIKAFSTKQQDERSELSDHILSYDVSFRVLSNFSKSLPYMSWFSSAGLAQSLGAPSSLGSWLREALSSALPTPPPRPARAGHSGASSSHSPAP